MAFRQTILRNIRSGVALSALAAALCCATPVWANTNTPDVPLSALSIAKLIEDQTLVETNSNVELSKPTTALDAINQIIEVLSSGNEERFTQSMSFFEEMVEAEPTQRNKEVFKIFKTYAELNDFEKLGVNYEGIRDFLTAESNHEDWFVSFHAKRLLSYVHTYSSKSSLALKEAEEALSLIPNEYTAEATTARISATELIAYLQNLKLNKELALLNTQRLIDLKLDAGQSVDGIELLNNLMYAYTAWRENDIRLELANTINRLEKKFGSTTPGLSSLHISRVYVDTGQYRAALTAAKQAVAEAKIDSLQDMAQINLATAYAGLGNVSEAKRILRELPKTAHGRSTIPYARTVIALKEGRVDDALKLMNTRFDTRVRRFLEENTQNTMEVLASLENSSERQAEREAALKREAALIQTRLNQQQNINKLLLALVALVTLMGVSSLLFARHRHKLAKLLAIKTEEAESADRMKTEFLGMVSHELRTPLNGIIGIADVLVAQGPTEEVRNRGNIILSSGNVLFNLIESIIDMSRLDGDKLELLLEPTQLTPILDDLTVNWQKEIDNKNIQFTSHIDEACREHIRIDPTRVRQCIDTLLSNAVKFTESGRIHLHVTSETSDDRTGRHFKIIVADTGQGISEDVQTKLFKPFLQADSSMTRKYGGSGLRLAIARSMARMMDGDIIVNSREGRGSEFTLTFTAPLSSENKIESIAVNKSSAQPVDLDEVSNDSLSDILNVTPNECEPITDEDEDNVFEMIELVIDQTKEVDVGEPTFGSIDNDNLEGCRVLIVEDIPSNQDVIELFLKPEGLKTFAVDSGKDALKMLSEHPFDFVIMDIRMPGMDGLETTQHIRNSNESWSNIPIIALTADTAAENNAACMAAGTDVFLTKPVLAKELLGAMRFLRQQREKSQGEAPLLLRNIV